MEDPEADRGRALHDRRRTWPTSTASPSAPSAATSRRCRRRASRSTTSAPTAARSGGWSRATSSALTQTFTLAELSALYFSKNLMSFLGGAPFAQDLESAFAKIRRRCPRAACPTWRASRSCSRRGPTPGRTTREAGRDRRAHRRHAAPAPRAHRVLLLQQPAHQDLHRSIPTGSSTTTAASTSTRGPRSTARCAPSRWSASRRSRCWTQSFEVPADFNVSEYARGAFGIAGGKPEAVELVFDAEMAGYIRERVWHESQALEEGPDGSVVLRMNVAPGLRAEVLDQGLPAPRAGGQAGRAARRDRARARAGPEGVRAAR